MTKNINLNSFLKTNNIEFIKNSVHPIIKKNSENIEKNFLNILIEQIKNQDPINPITNSELTSQIAQIKTAVNVEKIENLLENVFNESNLVNFIKNNFYTKN